MPSNQTVWENNTATVYEGETVQFVVQLSRTLGSGESVTVPLSNVTMGISSTFPPGLTTRLVSAPGVTLPNSSGLPTLTFTRGSRTATLALTLPNSSTAGNVDYLSTIMFGSITGAVANTMQNTLHFRVLVDEFSVCFSEDSYNIREGDDTKMVLQIERGFSEKGSDRTIGLRDNITVTFTYSLFTFPLSSLTQYEPFGSVTIPGGQVNVMLNSPILDDNEIESFMIGPLLTIIANSANAIGSCRTVITILDNDPTVTIAAGSDVTAGSTATFTVTRNAPQTSPLTVTLNVSESSDDNKNYVASTNEGQVTVSIPANQTMFVHSIPTISDNTTGSSDSILTVEVVDMSGSVSSTSGYYLGEASSDDLSILQERPPGIFIRGKVFLEGPLQ